MGRRVAQDPRLYVGDARDVLGTAARLASSSSAFRSTLIRALTGVAPGTQNRHQGSIPLVDIVRALIQESGIDELVPSLFKLGLDRSIESFRQDQPLKSVLYDLINQASESGWLNEVMNLTTRHRPHGPTADLL